MKKKLMLPAPPSFGNGRARTSKVWTVFSVVSVKINIKKYVQKHRIQVLCKNIEYKYCKQCKLQVALITFADIGMLVKPNILTAVRGD